MIMTVAGEYSAGTEAERNANFDATNQAAAWLPDAGQTPLVGINAALHVVERSSVKDRCEAIV